MKPTYYIFWYKLDQKDYYLLWFTSDVDGFYVNTAGLIPASCSLNSITDFAKESCIDLLMEEPILHDLDAVSSWIEHPETITPDCEILLAAWNMFDDVFTSLNDSFSKNTVQENKIYDKLFFGNNLPSITSKGKYYDPIWDQRETSLISSKMKSGLAKLRKSIIYV